MVNRRRQLALFGLLSFLLGFALLAGYLLYRRINDPRSRAVLAWLRNPEAHSDWAIHAGETCGQAPFLAPTSGLVGYFWGDSFRIGHRHQGLDIFAGAGVNQVEVCAAYPGYLTRLPDWKASVIIRVPDDPLNPGSQIWTYYTHMADSLGNSFISSDFPAGTVEKPVEAGALLGYQGNYSGTPGNPVGVHLHFSIVKDDGQGKWRNELDIRNTLDPALYLGECLLKTQE